MSRTKARAPSPSAALTQNSVRQVSSPAATPPTTGPSATAPKTARFIVIAVGRRRSRGQPITSGGTAAISISAVVKPWRTRPAMKTPAVGAQATATEARMKPTTKSTSSRRGRTRVTSWIERTVPKQ